MAGIDFVRVSTDAWGRQVLEGISWDLLPVSVALGVVVIIGHAIYRAFRKGR